LDIESPDSKSRSPGESRVPMNPKSQEFGRQFETMKREIEEEAERLKTIAPQPARERTPERSMRSFEEELHFLPELEVAAGVTNVRQICKYDGHQFIRTMYRQILRREPDHDGEAVYFSRFETGAHKFELILRLRFSREGRIVGTRLEGWFLVGLDLIFSRIPFLGYGYRILREIVLLPVTTRTVAFRQEQLREKINSLIVK